MSPVNILATIVLICLGVGVIDGFVKRVFGNSEEEQWAAYEGWQAKYRARQKARERKRNARQSRPIWKLVNVRMRDEFWPVAVLFVVSAFFVIGYLILRHAGM